MAIGRIVKAVGGFYFVEDGDVVRQCKARGIFKKKGISPLVGDQVAFVSVGQTEGIVEEVLPRTSELIRPPIANVDQVMLTFAVKDPATNVRLLDRLTVLAEQAGIGVLLCFTKCDLLDHPDQWDFEGNGYAKMNYPVVITSARQKQGIDDLRTCLRGKVTVLAGQSGVGKSTILNALYPSLHLKMGEISAKLNAGKHTTRHVELLRVEPHTFVADTPGFSQVDMLPMEPEELARYFRDFAPFRQACFFRGCLHEDEPDCAVRHAVETKQLMMHRYTHYVQFLGELKEAKARRY